MNDSDAYCRIGGWARSGAGNVSLFRCFSWSDPRQWSRSFRAASTHHISNTSRSDNDKLSYHHAILPSLIALNPPTIPCLSNSQITLLDGTIHHHRSTIPHLHNSHLTTQPYLDLHLSLGEGPHWDPVSRILRFVDIHAQTIHTVAPDVGPSSHTVVATLDTCVSHTAALAGVPDKYAFGGRAGIGIFDASTKTYKYVARWWAGEEEGEQGRREREMRGNDGGIDSRGRYFVGVMNEPRVVGLGPVGKWTGRRLIITDGHRGGLSL